jgi:hypothetical protein
MFPKSPKKHRRNLKFQQNQCKKWHFWGLFGAFATTTKPSFHPVFHPVTAKKTPFSANGYFIK